uniref:Uncharacterized protein n=1 Tax=Arundo donax TaxID=35708 RepID=A0A0A8XXV8_ARUDO
MDSVCCIVIVDHGPSSSSRTERKPKNEKQHGCLLWSSPWTRESTVSHGN